MYAEQYSMLYIQAWSTVGSVLNATNYKAYVKSILIKKEILQIAFSCNESVDFFSD